MKKAMLGTFLLIGGLITAGYVTVFALSHPTLTQSQIFLRFWPLIILSAGAGVIGAELIRHYTQDGDS